MTKKWRSITRHDYGSISVFKSDLLMSEDYYLIVFLATRLYYYEVLLMTTDYYLVVFWATRRYYFGVFLLFSENTSKYKSFESFEPLCGITLQSY